MPYDSIGRAITKEEMERRQEYENKHLLRSKVSNATAAILTIGTFIIGFFSTIIFIIRLIVTGGMTTVLGWAAAALLGLAFFASLFWTRVE